VLPLIALLVAQAAVPPWMTGQSRGEDLAVTLVTFGPGDSVPEWWGHSSLVVEDRRLGVGRLYNYGMFSFDQGFVSRFAQGRLEFWVDDSTPIDLTYRFYRDVLHRDVRLQALDLSPAQALEVAQALGTNVLPQNRVYLYHHYRDNCSTRPRDILDRALGGQLKQATSGPGRMSLREHTLRYSMVSPPMSLVLDFLQNDELEQPITQAQEAYLPDELERQLQALQIRREDGTMGPLVRSQTTWYRSDRAPPPERAPRWLPWELALGLGLAGVGLGLAHLGRDGARLPRVLLGLFTALWGLLGGLLGSTLFVMGALTNHTVTQHNENLFLLNPLTLALLPLGVMLALGSRRARRGLLVTWTALAAVTALGLACKVLWAFDQANWNLIALLAPTTGAFAALQWLDRRYQARRAAGPARVAGVAGQLPT
jgi:Domain of unknown function (DUF4105)